MFWLRELTLARAGTAAAQAAAMASRSVFFPQLSRYYQGLERGGVLVNLPARRFR
jgi:hypothetical protein